jgi:hypothetical protein
MSHRLGEGKKWQKRLDEPIQHARLANDGTDRMHSI